jgi:hypothetical protein
MESDTVKIIKRTNPNEPTVNLRMEFLCPEMIGYNSLGFKSIGSSLYKNSRRFN